MQNENLKVVEVQIASHEKQIAANEKQIINLGERLNDLSTSHQETVYLLKIYMENFKTFGKKIDDLAEVVKELMPGRKDWEFEKRLEVVENRQLGLLKYCPTIVRCVVFVIIALVIPELIPPILSHINIPFLHK